LPPAGTSVCALVSAISRSDLSCQAAVRPPSSRFAAHTA
jgi:hypothetical protein